MNFIVDCKANEEIIKNLEKLGNVYKSSSLKNLKDLSVSTHPDLQIHKASKGTFFCAPEVFDYYKLILPQNVNLISGKSNIGRTYPLDCAYNIGRIGNYVFCNLKYADENIINYYKSKEFNFIHVNQGYTKCNMCIVNDKTFITEDLGIYKKALEIPDILPIYLKENVSSLQGFNTGFIGGASGRFKDLLMFCGKVEPKSELEAILNKYDIKYLELSKDKICDYGSILTF